LTANFPISWSIKEDWLCTFRQPVENYPTIMVDPAKTFQTIEGSAALLPMPHR